MLAPPQSVGILGGMGPAAGADFVRLFVEACTSYLQSHGEEVRDQSFPEHWLVQMPIPDRTIAIQQSRADVQDPAPHLLQGVGRLAALGVRSVAVACNTAHVWHGQMQALFPQLSILHIAEETARHLQQQGAQKAILLATEGTYRTGLYDQTLRAYGIAPLVPDEEGVALLMQGIYEGVKRGDIDFASRRFGEVLVPLLARHGQVPVVMGCTEIPLALPQARAAQSAMLIDPSKILAQELARRAYEMH
ncbi:aspartate/glutamate racemase family protein [Diaphorobacter sp. HDW4A]|uniref:aspartate/glutamate racemase family protein n=1 Tax=Diaphorobacter sp. HDW4A TaxID=2714924 RepID=UPI001408C9AC|nr:amino acid racemase [Diaphorobacter sp. HDW4A]QIL82538.1 aspartate/glutamate racemase family protein [Diaphorobacter sp. HDW4A]